MTQTDPSSFHALTGASVRVKVVDIGANRIVEDPPYAGLLRAGHAEVVGFEPNRAALAELNAQKGPFETYLPDAVGDGGRHTLRFCKCAGMTSLLEPNPEVLNLFHGFPGWGEIIGTEEIDTVRLDDVPETEGVDFLKMDIQGAELMVLKNATRRLAGALVVQAEVEFLPLYVDQPLFSDVEAFLRGQGFLFHRFFPLKSRTFQPCIANGDIYQGLSQVVWADAVFVRDFVHLDRLSDRQLLAMGAILHACYRSLDLVYRVLAEYDRRTGAATANAYLAGV